MIRDLIGNWDPSLNLWAALPFLSLAFSVMVRLAIDASARASRIASSPDPDETPVSGPSGLEVPADAFECADCYWSGQVCPEHAGAL